MLILWITKRKTGDANCPQKDDKDAFQKHNEENEKVLPFSPRGRGNKRRGYYDTRWRYSGCDAKCEVN